MKNKQREHLTNKLEELKINPDSLSKQVGVSITDLSKFIMGYDNLSTEQLKVLGNVVNKDINWIKNNINKTEKVECENMNKLEKAELILTERELIVLKCRLGTDGNKPMSIEEVGEKLGVTRERVRQIEDKAIRRLNIKSGSGVEMIEESGNLTLSEKEISVNDSIEVLGLSIRPLNCLKGSGITTIKELISKTKKEIKSIKNLGNTSFIEVINRMDHFGLENKTVNHSSKESIESLDLSVRTHNCIKNAGIMTIQELSEKSKKEIKAFKNLGNTSFVEIINKLQSLGYEIK